jgi:hypothetical protein
MHIYRHGGATLIVPPLLTTPQPRSRKHFQKNWRLLYGLGTNVFAMSSFFTCTLLLTPVAPATEMGFLMMMIHPHFFMSAASGSCISISVQRFRLWSNRHVLFITIDFSVPLASILYVARLPTAEHWNAELGVIYYLKSHNNIPPTLTDAENDEVSCTIWHR